MGLTNRRLLVALSLIFLLSNSIFAFDLSPAPCAIVLIGCALAAALTMRTPAGAETGLLERPVAWPALGLCLLGGLALVILGGEGHLVFANSDWLIRDAVLNDLGRSATLPTYRIDGVVYALRAPLGMYMTPALAARPLGPMAGQAALVIQNAALLGGMIYMLYSIPERRRLGVVMLVLVFSGLDIVGEFAVFRSEHKLFSLATIPSHIEGWSAAWQYSSEITQIFWAPNHALPGWWLGILAMLAASGEVPVAALGLATATTALWSPLSAIGATPFILAIFLRDWRRTLASSYAWLCGLTALMFLPIVVYLTAAWASIEHGAVAKAGASMAAVLVIVLIFLTVEIPQFLIVLARFDVLAPARKLVMATSALTLAAIPFFVFGPTNDFAMRASIPSLLLLALVFSDVTLNGLAGAPAWRFAAVIIVALGAVTPALELERLLLFHRYGVSTCSLVEAQATLSPGQLPTNYMTRSDSLPHWLLRAARDVPGKQESASLRRPDRRCWPDYPYNFNMPVGGYSNATLLRSPQRPTP